MALGAGAAGLCPQPAEAQGTQFPDVPSNHWAYQAVTDLANEGYVKGYPDGSFLGKRALSRYEFATVIDRIVSTINDLSSKVSAAPTTPTGVPVTQDDLNKIQVLVDTFQPELTAIQSNVTDLQNQLDALRQDIIDAKAIAVKAYETAKTAETTADNSYGVGVGRKYTISGYIQTRFVAAASDYQGVFPHGLNSSPGIAGAYNGTYAQGGTNESAEVRRARIIVAGSPTANTSYRLQIDASGAVNTTANQQVTVREANGTYVFGDGSSKYPAITAGLFATPFGYVLPASQSANLTPERPLAFSESNNIGLFDSQDYDKGAKLSYGIDGIIGTWAVINGSGRNYENNDGHFDDIVRLQYASPTKIFNVGTSYYSGTIQDDTIAGSITKASIEPKKQLFGLDGQAKYDGFFADYEFVRGTYEKRSYFDEYTGTVYTNNPLGFSTDTYVKGNEVQGSYFWAGYTFFATTPKPLTLAFDYDTFQRSISTDKNASDIFATGTTKSGGNATYDDVNFGYGLLYNLDSATRLRLWLDSPWAVAHAPGTPKPSEYNLYTAELQFKF